jgi:hypothetical protein
MLLARRRAIAPGILAFLLATACTSERPPATTVASASVGRASCGSTADG